MAPCGISSYAARYNPEASRGPRSSKIKVSRVSWGMSGSYSGPSLSLRLVPFLYWIPTYMGAMPFVVYDAYFKPIWGESWTMDSWTPSLQRPLLKALLGQDPSEHCLLQTFTWTANRILRIDISEVPQLVGPSSATSNKESPDLPHGAPGPS